MVTETNPAAPAIPSTGEWLLLLYFLPAKHAQARVQAWRRLQRLGAVALKNSAYALPRSEEAREDFQWIKNEIVASGGQAMILVAHTEDHATRDEIVAAFRAARSDDFKAVAAAATALLKRSAPARKGSPRRLPQALRRLREQFEDISSIDFFGAPERDNAVELLTRLDAHTRKAITVPAATTAPKKVRDYRGKVWLTRPRPGVDRMSSAWLIRRFIDPTAQFAFGDPAKRPDAIPFDTFEAEFGHHGAHCTFETLCERFGIADHRAAWIGRIVHDLDLKEHVFREPEAATVGRLVDGLRRAHREDDTLLAQGIATFEALYQSADARLPSGPATTVTTKRRGRSARKQHRSS